MGPIGPGLCESENTPTSVIKRGAHGNKHLHLPSTAGHLARINYSACVTLMECPQSTGECLMLPPCRGFHRFKDIEDFHLWGQSTLAAAAPETSLESLQRDTVLRMQLLLFFI